MTNSYIITLFAWNNKTEIYEKKDDCIMKLNLETGDFKIITSSKNHINESKENEIPIYLSINIINDNVTIISRERNNIASMHNIDDNRNIDIGFSTTITSIDYEMLYNNKKFGIRFDARSSAAENNFYEEFMKLKKKYEFIEYYRSGNIKIEGKKTNNGYNGFCIEYYDTPISSTRLAIKYMGEFEDGLYDGEGEFFSADGNIRLICKNICSGKPNGVGKLIIGKNRVTKIIEMRNFVQFCSKEDKYTNSIYASIEPKYDDLMELLNFELLTIDDKLLYLLREIQKMKGKQNNNNNNNCNDTNVFSKSFFNIF